MERVIKFVILFAYFSHLYCSLVNGHAKESTEICQDYWEECAEKLLTKHREEAFNVTSTCNERILRKYYCKTRQPEKDEEFMAAFNKKAGSRSMYSNLGHVKPNGQVEIYNSKFDSSESDEEHAGDYSPSSEEGFRRFYKNPYQDKTMMGKK